MASIAASARRAAARCAFRAPARNNVAALRGLATFQLGRLNHVALAVPDIEEASAMWRDALGASVSELQALPDHGVTVCFVDAGNTHVELLEPLGDASPIAALAKSPSGGLHHLCHEVDDVEAAMADLKARGVRLLSEEPKIGAHGVPVVFLHPKDTNGASSSSSRRSPPGRAVAFMQEFSAWDYDVASKDDLLGQAMLNVSDLRSKPNEPRLFELQLLYKGKPRGEVTCIVTLKMAA
ncbi:lactoylglutathione lyase [Aureococcus anophagefferens]|nr:lactoylglutathione lyase [Aureococcus anophagefferens]